MSNPGLNFNTHPWQVGLFIEGKWENDVQKWMDVQNKFSGEKIAQVAIASPEDVNRAVVAASKAMKDKPLSAFDRYTILMKLQAALQENKEEIAKIIVAEAGKPFKEAMGEVNRAIQTVLLSAEEGKRIHGETLPLDAMPGMGGRVGLTLRVPIGVVAAITPFNYPLNLVAHKIAPAIAAGNAVVLKPASTTPLSSAILCKFLEEAGLPAGYINLVMGSGGAVGEALMTHPAVRMITFTGSRQVGTHIKAQSGLKRVTLELGNNSPNIVHYDADLDLAARLLAYKAFASAGQSCISVQRIYVHRDVAAAFESKIQEATNRLKVGDPMDPDTDVGPLISLQDAERVENWIQEALSQGARLVTGGRRDGVVVQPTLLADVNQEMRVCKEEVFGPVASLAVYDQLEQALELANDTVYGLQAGIFTRNIHTAWQAAQALEYGGVIINDASSFRADLMPYGGVKESGLGREGPRYAIEEMTELRAVVFSLV